MAGDQQLPVGPPQPAIDPPPSLPQMPANTEFGGGEHDVEMKTIIRVQIEVVPSPFSPRCSSRGANAAPKRSNPKTKRKAVELRKESTPAERKLWSRIRNDQLGVTFRRQHAIGNYIPDFFAIKPKLIIELDGLPHLHLRQAVSPRRAPGPNRVQVSVAAFGARGI